MRQTGLSAAAVAVAAAAILANGARTTPRAQARDGSDVDVLPVHGSLYLIAGGGANIAASVGKDGVLVVDSGAAAMTGKVLAAIRGLQSEVAKREPAPQVGWGAETRGTLQQSLNHFAPPKPIRYVTNTSAVCVSAQKLIVDQVGDLGAGEGGGNVQRADLLRDVQDSPPVSAAALARGREIEAIAAKRGHALCLHAHVTHALRTYSVGQSLMAGR